MENNRGGQRSGVYYSQEGSRRKSFNKKPPRGSSWQPAVPSWEKTFCKVIGSLDWETFVDTKKFVHLYDNVVKWDDSAGEEAFQNAKKRFLANMHGLPCEISMPDPDMYIDEVDWDSEVDLDMLLDLEFRDSVPVTTPNNEPVVIFGDSLLRSQGFSAPGWGDFEEDLKATPNTNLDNYNNSWERSLCKSKEAAEENNGWGESDNNATAPNVDGGAMGGAPGWPVDGGGAMGATGWPGSRENISSWNQSENQKFRNRRKNHASRQMSSYRNSSRFHDDEQTADSHNKWRNGISQKRAACF